LSQSPLKSTRSSTRSQKPRPRRMNPMRKSRYPRIPPLHNPRTPPPTPSEMPPLPTLPPHDLPPCLPRTHMAHYPKRNEHTVKRTTSACIVATEITRSKIAPGFEAQLKKATPSPTTPYLPSQPHLLLPSFLLPWETPLLRAPSDRITEGYYPGYFVDFVT